jgi:hypothetical protein
MSEMVNLADQPLSEAEQELVHTYRHLSRALQMYGDEMAPYQRRNGLKALAALWQVMNGLDMDPGQLYDVGA